MKKQTLVTEYRPDGSKVEVIRETDVPWTQCREGRVIAAVTATLILFSAVAALVNWSKKD